MYDKASTKKLRHGVNARTYNRDLEADKKVARTTLEEHERELDEAGEGDTVFYLQAEHCGDKGTSANYAKTRSCEEIAQKAGTWALARRLTKQEARRLCDEAGYHPGCVLRAQPTL